MAFCKFCGKVIPEGSVCGCPESQKDAPKVDLNKDSQQQPQSQFSNVAQNAQAQLNNAAHKVDGLAGELSENLPGNMKGNKNIVLVAGGVAVLIVLVLLFTLIGGTGAKGAVKKYMKAMTKKNGAKTIISYTLPEDYIKELKDDDEWDDIIEEKNDDLESELEDVKIKIKKIEKKDKLSEKELKGAQLLYEMCFDDIDDIEVTKGYEYKVKVQSIEDGDKDTDNIRVCVLKLKGDGWKVLPIEKDSLKSLKELADDYKKQYGKDDYLKKLKSRSGLSYVFSEFTGSSESSSYDYDDDYYFDY